MLFRSHLLITITPHILTGTDAASVTVSDELSFRSEQVAAEYTDLYGRSCTSCGSGAVVTYEAPSSRGSGSMPVVIDGSGVEMTPPSVDPIPVAPGR